MSNWIRNEYNTWAAVFSNPGEAAAGAVQGALDGSAMVANALTLHTNDRLNDYVTKSIEANGGVYGAANAAATAGAIAVYSAGAVAAPTVLAEAAAAVTGGSGLAAAAEGGAVVAITAVADAGAAAVTVTEGVQIAGAIAATSLLMTGNVPDGGGGEAPRNFDSFDEKIIAEQEAMNEARSLGRFAQRMADEAFEAGDYEAYDVWAEVASDYHDSALAIKEVIRILLKIKFPGAIE